MIRKFFSGLGESIKTQKELCVVCLGSIVYTVVFSTISFLRYDAFSYTDFDFAIFVHEAWKAWHGSANISILNDLPIWGNALELVSFMTAPLFFLFNFDPKGLLFLQALAHGASAVPVFLIAHRKLPAVMAMCLALSFLFFPAVWYANLYEYYPIVFTTFTLLMAFYFFELNRFGWFMFFIVISMLNRVDVGLVTVMFGLYALTERRPWKWVLWPSLLSIVWVVLGLFVIIPAFNPATFHDAHYSQFGKGFGEIIRNMLLHPELVAKVLFTPDKVRYFFEMFLPVVFFPLLGLKQFLICSLSIFQHMASSRAHEHSILYHYTATVTPFIYISAVYGMARFNATKWKFVFLCFAPLFFSILANLQYGPLSKKQDYIAQLTVNSEDRYKKELLKEITADAVVTGSFEFSPMLAGRDRFYSFHFIYSGLFLDKKPYKTPDDSRYALINFNDLRLVSFQSSLSDINTQEFLKNNQMGIVDHINGTVLYKRGLTSMLKLYDTKPLSADAQVVFDVEKRLNFLGADHRYIRKRGFSVLQAQYRWQAAGKVYDDIWVFTDIVDQKGKVYNLGVRSLCYSVFHPSHWDPDTAVAEYYDLVLPDDLPNGEYRVKISLHSVNSNRKLPLSRRTVQGELLDVFESAFVGSFLKGSKSYPE